LSTDVVNHVRVASPESADDPKRPETGHCVHRKLFGAKCRNEREKLKNIREEGEPMLNDGHDDGVGVGDVDVDERLLDVGNNYTSIRILERRYHQPMSDADVDVEMATVLITFPRN
jgi:hypothetical protein